MQVKKIKNKENNNKKIINFYNNNPKIWINFKYSMIMAKINFKIQTKLINFLKINTKSHSIKVIKMFKSKIINTKIKKKEFKMKEKCKLSKQTEVKDNFLNSDKKVMKESQI